MEILILVAAVVVLFVWFKSKEEKSGTTWNVNKQDEAPKEKVQITKNIYGAVETFAALCHMWKKNTGWSYETLDFAWIRVKYKGSQISLEMQCRGDCMALQVTNQFPEIKADSDNIVVYNSSEVHSLNPDNPHALWDAFKAGSPNAVLEDISATPGNIFVQIKFEN